MPWSSSVASSFFSDQLGKTLLWPRGCHVQRNKPILDWYLAVMMFLPALVPLSVQINIPVWTLILNSGAVDDADYSPKHPAFVSFWTCLFPHTHFGAAQSTNFSSSTFCPNKSDNTYLALIDANWEPGACDSDWGNSLQSEGAGIFCLTLRQPEFVGQALAPLLSPVSKQKRAETFNCDHGYVTT